MNLVEFASMILFILFNASLFYFIGLLIRNMKKSRGSFKERSAERRELLRIRQEQYEERQQLRMKRLAEQRKEKRADKKDLENAIKELFDESLIFKNAYVPKGNGFTIIDVLAIHPTGIYVFEYKDFKGDVLGDVEANNWLCRNTADRDFIFYNPVFQSDGHIKAIINNLNLDELAVVPFVVFGWGVRMSEVKGKHSAPIFHIEDIQYEIFEKVSTRETIFGDKDIDALVGWVKKWKEIGNNGKISHINALENVREIDDEELGERNGNQ